VTDQGENPDGERPTPEDGGDPDPAAARFEQFKLARAFEPRTDAPQRVKGLNSSSLVSAGVADSMAKLASSAVFTSGLADSVAKLNISPLLGLADSVAKLNSSSLVSAGVADSMAKLASSAVFTSGLADSVAKLNISPLLGLADSVAKLNSSSLVSAGVADSMAKLASSAVFTSGLADSVAKLASSPVFTSAVADLLAEIEVEGIGADASAVRLDRKQQRLICGYLAYVIVWLLVLQVMINMLGTDDALANVISLTTVMTGLSGHVIATLAKKTAFWAYDQLNPPVE